MSRVSCSPDGAERNPGQHRASHCPRIALRSIRATCYSPTQALLPRKRLLDGQEIAPDEAFFDRVAQEIGRVEARDGADLAGAGVIGVPAPARSFDAFLDAEQRLRRRTTEADQHIGIGQLDL